MSKDEFLSTLDRKLQVINEKERRDIIDEYRMHIEMKMADGKSEEEVIEDFGNIDELVDEILDAYKINTDRVNQSFDFKFNNFMDDLYNGFKRFISSFTSLEVDDVVKLIFEVIVILIILGLLHVPFSIVEWLGSSILRNVIGFGFGHVLSGIWRVVIELAYAVIFIVVIVNVVSKRVQRYRNPSDYDTNSTVFDDFKNTFNFDQRRSTTNHSYKNKDYKDSREHEEAKKEEYKSKDFYEEPFADENVDDIPNEDDVDTKEDTTTMNSNENQQQKRDGYESYHDRVRPKNPKTGSVGDGVSGALHVLMRIFFVLFAIPFIGVIVGLSCALGAMVVFSIQGFTLFGAYFLVIGGILITSAFLSLLKTALWRRG